MTNLDRSGKILCVTAFVVTLPLVPLLHEIPLVPIRWWPVKVFVLVTPVVTAILAVCWYRILVNRVLLFRRFGSLSGTACGVLTYFSYALLLAGMLSLGDAPAGMSALFFICTIGFLAFGWVAILIGGLAGAFAQHRYPLLSSNPAIAADRPTAAGG